MDDLISRQAVLEEIEKVCFSKDWSDFRINLGSNGQRDYLIKFIKQLSPVNPNTQITVKDRLSEKDADKKESGKRFVKITRTSGSKIALNKDWITAMVPQTNGTRVYTGDGDPIYVLETMEEMLDMIEGW